MSVKSNFKAELGLRLSMLNEKETAKRQLEYEIELIRKDCLDIYHSRRSYTEICEFVDIHSAWITQPKKITHKVYTMKNLRTKYHWFMYWVQNKIFENILDDVKFCGKLVIIGFSCVSISVPFTYKGVKFEVRIPNIQAIQTFDDMLNHGSYSVLHKPSDSLSVEIARIDGCEELKEKIKEVLDKEIKDESNGRKCDLKTVC